MEAFSIPLYQISKIFILSYSHGKKKAQTHYKCGIKLFSHSHIRVNQLLWQCCTIWFWSYSFYTVWLF